MSDLPEQNVEEQQAAPAAEEAAPAAEEAAPAAEEEAAPAAEEEAAPAAEEEAAPAPGEGEEAQKVDVAAALANAQALADQFASSAPPEGEAGGKRTREDEGEDAEGEDGPMRKRASFNAPEDAVSARRRRARKRHGAWPAP
jgi:hypothetical protein